MAFPTRAICVYFKEFVLEKLRGTLNFLYSPVRGLSQAPFVFSLIERMLNERRK